MTFEENVKKLEQIVAKMEDGSTTLSEGIELYSEGIEITRRCLDILNDGKDKIKALQAQMAALFDGETENDENKLV